MTTETQTPIDPMDAAMNAEVIERPPMIFGEMAESRAYFTNGKWDSQAKQFQEFNPDLDSPDSRKTAVLLILTPIKGQWDYTYNPIAQYPDWALTTLPSLRTLKADIRSLKGQFVQIERVSRNYTAKATGEQKTAYVFKFVAIYPDFEACQAAADEFFNNPQSEAATPATAPAAVAAPAATSDKERETALRFLPALWTAAGKDVTKFAEKIAATPLVAKYFTIESQEVLTIIGS